MISETPTFIPAVYLGDVTEQKVYALGAVASGRRGLRVSVIRLLTTRDVAPDTGAYWTIHVGTLSFNGNFKTLTQFSLARSGLKAGGYVSLTAKPAAVFQPGDMVAVRMKANGKPAPVEGCSIILDYVPITTGV